MTAHWPDIERWLAPQARYESLRAETTRRHGPRVCDLAYANAWDGPSQATLDALSEAALAAKQMELQYTPYGGNARARRVAARELTELTGLSHGWQDVILTPGAMAALTLVFRHLAADGGEAVIVTPCWLDTPVYVAQAGLEPRLVPMRPDGGLDLEAMEAAIGPRTRVVVLSQPNNPTGRIHREEELEGLTRILRNKASGAALLSDECHRDYLEDQGRFVCPSKFWARTFTVYSYGKRWLLQGQRLGYVAICPESPDREYLRSHLPLLCRSLGLATPTALMQSALHRLVASTPAPKERILERRARVVQSLSDNGAAVHPGDGTMFIYVAAPGGDAERVARELAEEGVLTLPSDVFHQPGHLRLSMTATDEMIERALPVLVRALGKEARAA